MIKPSRDAVARLRRRLKGEWLALNGNNAAAVTGRLNPIIRGWANYHRVGVAKRIFSKLDAWMFFRSKRHAKRMHPKKMWGWISARYWRQRKTGSSDRWVFGPPDRDADFLLKFSWTKIVRHVLVQGRASPDDARLRDYWDKRRKRRNQELPRRQQRLADRQDGLCPHCRTSLHNGEELHRHHVVRRRDRGTDEDGNLRLVHLYCHQQIHAGDRAKALDAMQFA